MSRTRTEILEDFFRHSRLPIPAREIPIRREKTDRFQHSSLTVDSQLPTGWSWKSKGEQGVWRSTAFSPEGARIEAKGRTLAASVANLSKRLASPEKYLEMSATRARVRARSTFAWKWPTDPDEFLREVCYGEVEENRQRRYLEQFLRRNRAALEGMPDDLRAELARRDLLPGSYWPLNSDRPFVDRFTR